MLTEVARLLRFLLLISGALCTGSSYLLYQEVKRRGTETEVLKAWQRLHGHVSRRYMVAALGLYLGAFALDTFGFSGALYGDIRLIADGAHGPTSPLNILRYTLIGVGAEGCFTMLHDRKEHGYSSPWYIMIYWTIPVWAIWTHHSEAIGALPFWIRGFVHMLAIYVGEFLWMYALRRKNGRSPSQDEYENERWNYKGLIRLDLWYAWYAAGLVFELLVVSQFAGLPRYHWWF